MQVEMHLVQILYYIIQFKMNRENKIESLMIYFFLTGSIQLYYKLPLYTSSWQLQTVVVIKIFHKQGLLIILTTPSFQTSTSVICGDLKHFLKPRHYFQNLFYHFSPDLNWLPW